MYYAILFGNVCVNRIKAGSNFKAPAGYAAVRDDDGKAIPGGKFDARTKTWTRPAPSPRQKSEREADLDAAKAIAQKDSANLSMDDVKALASLIGRSIER